MFLSGLEDVHLVVVQQPGEHQRVHLVRVQQASLAGSVAGIGQGFFLHDPGNFGPVLVGSGDDPDEAVLARVDSPGGAAVSPVAHPGVFHAGVAVLHESIFEDIGGVLGDG